MQVESPSPIRAPDHLLLGLDDEVLVVGNLVVKAVKARLHLGHALADLLALLLEDGLARPEGGVAALEELHVLDERLDGDVGAAHALDEAYAREVLLAVVADAALVAVNVREQANALVVAQGVRADAKLL